eukprot:Pgem_evm2s2095
MFKNIKKHSNPKNNSNYDYGNHDNDDYGGGNYCYYNTEELETMTKFDEYFKVENGVDVGVTLFDEYLDFYD